MNDHNPPSLIDFLTCLSWLVVAIEYTIVDPQFYCYVLKGNVTSPQLLNLWLLIVFGSKILEKSHEM